ncbi:protease HtpX [Thorsellia kenyensis]|uniref:Protease HtpX n=1 Tax=Thorsellia kenyensis TaxID=1549888 RepID=A0ABV6CF97_9GAMM
MIRIGLFLLTNLAVMVLFGIILSITGISSSSTSGLLIMAVLFGFAGSIISLLLSKTIALKTMGARVISNPSNEMESWLVNTVKSQAQQVGIGMPTIAIYESSDLNAFATGAKRDDALVAVSTGLLSGMHRDEVEAVLAHEVSHIANGDMVTMTLLQGVVNTFVIFISRMIAQVVATTASGSSEDEEGGESFSAMTYFGVSMVLEIVFGLLASIITLWFSRYREFHADAGAARLVGAEKMIAALERLKQAHEPQVEKSMTVLAINAAPSSFGEYFMSHPPLDKRIEALRQKVY